jgi:hypothetical protein
MVEWLAGNRIQGTSTERTVGTPEVPAVSGGWKEVARTTLGSAGDVLNVSSIPDKRYYMVLSDFQDSGNIQPALRLGNSSLDSSANYRERWSTNGGSDVTQSNTYHVQWVDVTGKTKPIFGVNYIANKSGKEKLGISHIMNNGGNGAGNAPAKQESVFKWTGTSVMDILGYNNLGNGDYASGSEVVVLGYDPDDTHTDNFWEELANVDLSGGSADLLSSGTITAKKYLWVQAYIEPTGTVDIDVTFNNDTGANYARRNNYNGGTDSTNTSQNNLQWSNNVTVPQFMNCFIINNSANEKLSIMEQVRQGTAGAGTAPDRYHISGKWANTSSQITEIDITNGESGSYDTKSFIKVWGAD